MSADPEDPSTGEIAIASGSGRLTDGVVAFLNADGQKHSIQE